MTGGAQGHREHMWKSLGSVRWGWDLRNLILLVGLFLEAESHSNPNKP